ncbi:MULTISPECIES: hypothetical protein [unclassified Streptomyces]|uniref:hypothetical protein n=1 Tax=unclassified Streptomyces TaxID=2593676 RepID=UPI0006AF7994|nr:MULTISPECIES: hypothetical protein [unclassified Streptomyces]KOX29096.1 hypothetical protein ADL06_13155 [Streptomyces sp. NRRL F-6491]KOX43963.1 hypothetical protein ADL08_14535 [Streptomyces sp. NRRL F-6492]
MDERATAPEQNSVTELDAQIGAGAFWRLVPESVPREYAEPTRALIEQVHAGLKRLAGENRGHPRHWEPGEIARGTRTDRRDVPAGARAEPPEQGSPPAFLVNGSPVFDPGAEMVGVVRSVKGALVSLQRPSGYRWQAAASRLRPATPYQRRQLEALARHSRRVRRAEAPVPAGRDRSGLR